MIKSVCSPVHQCHGGTQFSKSHIRLLCTILKTLNNVLTIKHLYFSYYTHYMQQQTLKTLFHTNLPKRHVGTDK